MADKSYLAITEMGGKRRQLVLRGRSLPHAGTMQLRGESDVPVAQYGFHQGQRVVGHSVRPFTLSGTWKTRTLASMSDPPLYREGVERAVPFDLEAAETLGREVRTSRELETIVWSMRLSGVLLLLQTSFGDTAYGRIESAVFGRGLAEERPWSLSFAPVEYELEGGDGAVAASARADRLKQARRAAIKRRTFSPKEMSNDWMAVFNTALQGVRMARYYMGRYGFGLIYDTVDALRNGPLALFEAGGAAFEQACAGILGVSKAVLSLPADAASVVSGSAVAARSVPQVAGFAESACFDLLTACGGISAASASGSNDAAARFEAADHMSLAFGIALAGMERAAQWRESIETAREESAAVDISGWLQSKKYRVVIAGPGDTLQSIAHRELGSPDLAWMLAAYNHLPFDAEPEPTQRLRVPEGV